VGKIHRDLVWESEERKIGDEFPKSKWRPAVRVVKIEKPFLKYIPDEDACAWGLPPGDDYRIRMQYVTFEEIDEKEDDSDE